jgi:hypothetical protein
MARELKTPTFSGSNVAVRGNDVMGGITFSSAKTRTYIKAALKVAQTSNDVHLFYGSWRID